MFANSDKTKAKLKKKKVQNNITAKILLFKTFIFKK